MEENNERRAGMLESFCKDFGKRSEAMKIAGGIVVAAIMVSEAIEYAAQKISESSQ